MKKGYCLSVFASIFLGLLLCCSAQAQVCKGLLDQADSLSEAANFDSAIVIAEMALKKAELQFGDSDTTVALVLYRMGIYRTYQANYSSAQSLLKRALAIREKMLGPEHPDVAMSLNGLAQVYWKQGRYMKAEPLYKRALAIEEKSVGPEHLDVAVSLDGLARVYWEQGKDTKAEPLYKRALAIRERSLGPDHPDVASSLNGLAGVFWRQGKYVEAEPLLKRAIEIREKALGLDHRDVGESTNNLAIFYLDQGQYAEAEPLFKRTLAIYEKALGPDHPNVARSLHNLGAFYHKQGRYAQAEPLYKRAVTIREKSLGSDHFRVAQSLTGLGGMYTEQGRYMEAEPLLERAIAIEEKSLGLDHPSVATSIGNLAGLYWAQGKDMEAEPLFKRALAIREKTLGPDHPYVCEALDNLAAFYADQSRFTEAESLLTRALSIWERSFGRIHREMTKSLTNLANLYRDQDKYVKAESLYQEASIIAEKTLEPNHPYVGYVFHNMALLFKNKKDFAISRKKAKRACTIRRNNFREGSAVLSEKDALTYSKFMRDEANQYISILLDSQDTNFSCRKEIAEVVFSTKGQVSDGIFARHKTHVYEKNPSLKVLSDSLRHIQFKLANLYVQAPDQEDPEGYRKELIEAGKEKERLEAELARRSAEFRHELELWEVDAEKIASALPSKSILIEYFKYDRLKTNRETEPRYLLLMVNNQKKVFVSDLGSANQIDSIVAMYRSHFQEVAIRGGYPFAEDMGNYDKISTKLYESIWKPIENQLGNANLVFVAPDGELNLISFVGLKNGAGEYLIENYTLHYLSSGRDLIRLKEKAKIGMGLFALGDPDFEAFASTRLSSVPTLHEVGGSITSDYMLRNIRPSCEELSKITVLPLLGTRKEIERVSEVWKHKIKEPYHIFLGREANEDNFKKDAPGNKVIHLATHGYFVQSECQRELKFKVTEGLVGENPLLLSGLFLAGANLHGKGADSLGVEDGILTALEVTAMNLEGVNWVVLSACESGLGEVKSGEGVYGLRRAFQMAGAHTVISALWPVSDKTTSEMMSYLYDYKEDNLASAMKSLARNKLTELRQKNKPDHPYLWAGFIAIGDWR